MLQHGYPKDYAYTSQTNDVRTLTEFDPYNFEKDNEPILDLLDNQFALDTRLVSLEDFVGGLQILGVKVTITNVAAPDVTTDYLDLNNYSVRNLALTPERDGDASSKYYVDTLNDDIVERLPNAVNTNGADFQQVNHSLIIDRLLGGDGDGGYALDIVLDDIWTGSGNTSHYVSLRAGKLLNDDTNGGDFGLTPVHVQTTQFRIGIDDITKTAELLFVNSDKDTMGGEYPGIRIRESFGSYLLEYRATNLAGWSRFDTLLTSASYVSLTTDQVVDGRKAFVSPLSIVDTGNIGVEINATPQTNFVETLAGIHFIPGIDNCTPTSLQPTDEPINLDSSKVRIGFLPGSTSGVSPELEFYLSSKGSAKSPYIQASLSDSKMRWYYYDEFDTLVQNLFIEPQAQPAPLVVNTAAITDAFIQAAIAGVVTYINDLVQTLNTTNTLK